MYRHADTDAKADRYVEVIKSQCGGDSSNLTLGDGLCNPRYRIATWINIGYIVFHELTGINVINMYSNTMFTEMSKEGAGFTPRQGTYLIGAFQVLGTIMST